MEYLSADTIIAINLEVGGPGAGIGDHTGLEALAGRPMAGHVGGEYYPDVWSKAAVYLHGLSTTQYFNEGNKRTAWNVATTFLALNGRELPRTDDVEAESFVRAVAAKLFDSDADPDGTMHAAAEWLRLKWENQPAGGALDPRLEYVFLAADLAPFPDAGMMNVEQLGLATIVISAPETKAFPRQVHFFIAGRLHWRAADQPLAHKLVARVVPPAGGKRVNRATYHMEKEPFSQPPSGHPAHAHTGVMPMIFWLEMNPIFLEPNQFTVELDLDGSCIARLPLKIDYIGPGEGLPGLPLLNR